MTTSNLFLVCAFLIVGISRASATTERGQLVVIVALGSWDEKIDNYVIWHSKLVVIVALVSWDEKG